MAGGSGGLQLRLPNDASDPLTVSFTNHGLLKPLRNADRPVLDLWDALVVALAHQHRTRDDASILLWNLAHDFGSMSFSGPSGTLSYGLPGPVSICDVARTRIASRAYDDLMTLWPAARAYSSLRANMCADHLALALTGIDGITPSAAQAAVALHRGHLPAVPVAQPESQGARTRDGLTLVVVGASQVGKTRLLEKVTEIPLVRTDRPANGRSVTTALDFGRLTLDGQQVRLVGTPGEGRFATARATCLRTADGVLVLADPTTDTATARELLEQLTARNVPHALALTSSTGTAGSCPRAPVTTPPDLPVASGVPVLSVDLDSDCSIRQVLRVLAFRVDAMTGPESAGRATPAPP